MGHENPEMSARYGRQLVEDVAYRAEWPEKVGLGFELPLVSNAEYQLRNRTLFALRALQNE